MQKYPQVYSEYEVKKQMIDVGRRVWEKGWVASNDGNFSYRLNDKEILCTPTGVSKSMITMENICKVDINGDVIGGGKYRPSSEIKMHLQVMRDRPDVRSVIHAHPPNATAHAIAGIPLAECVIPEIIVGLGSVPIAPYGTPSTDEIPDRLRPLLKNYDAWLLENHGTLAAGNDVYQAYFRTESVELFAQMMVLAKSLGNVNKLNNANTKAIIDLRSKFGIEEKDNVCVSCGACGKPSCEPEGASPGGGAPSYANQPDGPLCTPPSSSQASSLGMSETELINLITQKVKDALK